MTIEREMPHRHGEDMDAQLERILEAYAAAEPGPSKTTLAAWIREYPQFAKELTQFTASWQLLEWAGGAVDGAMSRAESEAASNEDERLILRGVSAAQSVFYAKRAARETQTSEALDVSTDRSQPATPGLMRSGTGIYSLLDAASRAGLTYVAFKESTGLSDGLLQKLNRRLIDPLTIPVRVIADLAAAVRRQIESVAAYLALPPTFAAGAQHRANQAPTLPKAQEDFFDAVRNDATLRQSRKEELLALSRPERNVRSREDSQ